MIYDNLLLKRYKSRTHRGELRNYTVKETKTLYSCGDRITLFLEIENGVVKSGSYLSESCLITDVNTDIMIDNIIGKTTDEARKLADEFIADKTIEKYRANCANLCWETLKGALTQ